MPSGRVDEKDGSSPAAQLSPESLDSPENDSDPRYDEYASLWRALRPLGQPSGRQLRARVMNALLSSRILSPEDLRGRSIRELSRVRNLGPDSIRALIDAGLVVPSHPGENYCQRAPEYPELWDALARLGSPNRARVYRLLVDGGVRTPDELGRRTPGEVCRIRGMGGKLALVLEQAGLLSQSAPALDTPGGSVASR